MEGRLGYRLERKREHGCRHQQTERNNVVPGHFLMQKQHREDQEHGERDDLLQDLQLKAAEMQVTPAVGRYCEAILDESDTPGDRDGPPQRPVVAVLQMA